MARTASGYHLLRRGARRAWHVWFADGHGGKVWRRVVDRCGQPIPPETPKAEADRHAARIYSKWREEAACGARPGTFGELTDAYVRQRLHRWTKATRRQYAVWLGEQESFFGSRTPLARVDAELVEEFQRWLGDERKLAATSINARVAFARSIFLFAFRKRWIDESPFNELRPVKGPRVRPLWPFQPEEIRQLLRVARERFSWFYPLLLVAVVTGCRDGALLLLDVEDFKSDKGILLLPDGKAKGGKGIAYHLPAVCCEVLRGLTRGRVAAEPLFVNRQGRRFSSKAFDTQANPPRKHPSVWRRLLDAAGVTPRNFHNLRASVDTNLARNGATVDEAVSVTGHTVDVARRCYVDMGAETQRRMMDRLCGLYHVGEPDLARQDSPDPIVIRGS